MYWADIRESGIYRANMDTGGTPEVLVSTNLIQPLGIAIDVNSEYHESQTHSSVFNYNTLKEQYIDCNRKG